MLPVRIRIQNGTETTGEYSTQFISALKANGRMVSTRILKGNSVYAEEDINSCNIYWDASLFKSVMKCAEIEFNGIIIFNKNDILNDILVGVSEDNGATFYYVQYGRFTITEVTYDFEQLTTKVIAYDDMIKAMKPYDLSIEYSESYTNANFFSAILTETGISGYTPSTSTYPVLSQIRNHETYNDSYTYRDVLDDFAEILGTVLFIGNSNNIQPATASSVYSLGTDSDWFAQQLATFTKTGQFGKINRIVLSRAPQEDNVVYSASTDGEEIKFINNQLVEGYADSEGIVDRTPYLQLIYTKCHSWNEFSTYEFDSYGYLLFQPGDTLAINDSELGVDYGLYLSGNIKITQGIKESGETTAPESSETDYTKAATNSQQERDTYLYVDKVNQTVTTQIRAVDNKVNNIAIGGRNLIRDTRTYFDGVDVEADESAKSWTKSTNTTLDTEGQPTNIITFPTVTANAYNNVTPYNKLSYSLVRNRDVIFSCYVKADSGLTCVLRPLPALYTAPNGTSYVKYHNKELSFTGTGDWEQLTWQFTITDDFFTTGSGTIDFDNCYFTVMLWTKNTNWNGYQVKAVKLELGNKATDWTPAPEDEVSQSSSIQRILNHTISVTAEGTTESITKTVNEALYGEDGTAENPKEGSVYKAIQTAEYTAQKNAEGSMEQWVQNTYTNDKKATNNNIEALQTGAENVDTILNGDGTEANPGVVTNVINVTKSVKDLKDELQVIQNGIGKAFRSDLNGAKVMAIKNGEVQENTYTLTDENGNHYIIKGTESGWATNEEFGTRQLSIGQDSTSEKRWQFKRDSDNRLNINWHND